jgi:tetratricopeptide (TPR) repeat protein
VALFCALPSIAEDAEEVFPLRPATRERLAQLQDLWIEWLTQIQEGNSAAAEVAVEELLKKSEGLGMQRLPELSVAAAVQGVGMAENSEFERAWLAIAAAEALDADRPESALAAGSVARLEGRYGTALKSYLVGVLRIVRVPVQRRILVADFVRWALVFLCLSALAFIVLEMSTRGSELYYDLAQFIGKSLPAVFAYLLVTILLLWPILLPSGLLWLTLYWSVLLWGYGSRLERLAMVVCWLFLGSLPVIVSEHGRRVELAVSPQIRAVENAAQGRLAGVLFSDLALLRSALPESVAVKHLEADLHLKLHQWELARARYREVLVAEPDNVAAMTDIGTSLFYEGDLESAERQFRKAAQTAETAPAEAYFNLSRALSEQYRFEESEAALRQASAIDSEAVSRWIADADTERVILVGDGLRRRHEIARDLGVSWRQGRAGHSFAALWRRTLSLPLALVLVVPAIAVYLLARRAGYRKGGSDRQWWSNRMETVRRIFLPGFPEMEEGDWWRGLRAIAIPMALLSIPLAETVVFGVPLGFYTRGPFLWPIAVVGLVLFFVLRAVRVVRSGG